MWVHHHVREDAETLYGFATRDERVTFEALLGAHGVGPVAGAGDPVGPRPPRRWPASWPRTTSTPCAWSPAWARRRRPGCWSSSSRGSTCPRSTSVAVGPATRRRRQRRRRRPPPSARSDVRAALAGLGYSADEIRERHAPSCPTTATPRELLRQALPHLARRARCDGPVREELLDPDVPARRGVGRRRRPAPPAAGRVRGPGRAQGAPRHRARGRPPAGPGAPTTCCSPARPGWARPRWPHHRQRAGRPPAHHVGPRARAGRRPGRHPHPARRRRRAVHRRDPPPAPRRSRRCSTRRWRTSSSTSCWARARRPGRSASTCPASRWWAPPPAPARSPARCATASAWSPGSTTTRPPTSRPSSRAGGRHPRRAASTTPAAPRSPAGPAARPASPTACCAGCATSPRSGATAPSTGATAEEGLALFGVDELGLDKVDRALLSAAVRALRRGPGGAVDAGHQRRRADRDRRGRLRAVPHPAGPADAHARGAGWPCRRPGTTSAWRRRRPGGTSGDRAHAVRRADHRPGRRQRRHTPMDVADFDYELPEASIAQMPIEPRDVPGCWSTGGPARPPSTARSPTCPRWCAPGDVVVRQHHPGAAGPAAPATSRPGARSRCCCSRRRPTASGRPWSAPAAGCRRAPAGGRGRPDRARRGGRRPGRGRPARRAAAGRRADELAASTATARCRCRPTSPSAAGRPRALPDGVSPTGRARWRRPPPGSTSPRASSTAAGPPGREIATRRPGRRPGHVPADHRRRVEDHHMHAERYRVPAATLRRAAGRRRRGWWPWARPPCGPSSRRRARASSRGAPTCSSTGPTGWQVVDVLLTNFHLPRSSLLVLVDAFVGAPLARPLRHRPRPRATASCPSATPCCWRGSRPSIDGVSRASDPGRGAPTATARAGTVHHRPGHVRHAVLHAGRHPGRGAHAVVGRPRATSAPRWCWPTPTT